MMGRRNRTGGGLEGLAPLRRLVTDVTRMTPGKEPMRGKPKKAGWSDNALVEPVRTAVRLKPPQRKS